MTAATTEPHATQLQPDSGELTERTLRELTEWLQGETRHRSLVSEELLWREAYLRYRTLQDHGADGHRLWTSIAAQFVFESPGTPRNERDAARQAASLLLDNPPPALYDQARTLNQIADRANVERSKLLGLLAPGVGYPWMFPRELWNPAVVATTLEAVLGPFDWAPGADVDGQWLAGQVRDCNPQQLVAHLLERAPEGSDLRRMLSAIAAYVRSTDDAGKDVSVVESRSFLSALEYHGLSSHDTERLRSELLALRSALVLVVSFQQYHLAEGSVALAQRLRATDAAAAAANLRRAANIYKRMCVAQMYPERLLQRFQEVSRELEETLREGGGADPRRPHVLLVSTLNSPADVQRVLQSVAHELIDFAYGEPVHVVISDDSSAEYRDQNVRLLADMERAGLSVSHWDGGAKNAYLDELNREVFPDARCDVRDLAGNRRPGEKGVPYGRFRNFLRLVAMKEVRESGLDEPILTWLDQDNQIGALVLTKAGTLSERHVFHYFDQKSQLFAEHPQLLVGGGGYTNDALEGVEKFWVAWGILHQVFGLAQQHAPDDAPLFPAEADITRFRPWDQADTLERLRREGEAVETVSDQVLLLFSTLVGTFRGKYDNQVQIFHPWTYGYVDPDDDHLIEEVRAFAGMPGGNTTFTTEVLGSPVPFITVGGRGEDIFHLWQIEAEHGPGSVCLTHTPALHTRNVGTGRSDLMTEIIDSFNGRIFREPPLIWGALSRLATGSLPDGRSQEQLEADTASYIENLRNEAKSSIAAVSGFAGALEPYLDEKNQSWWLRRAEFDPQYEQLVTKLRGMVADFKQVDKYQAQADARLLSLDDVKELTDQFFAAYPHWQTVVEHVGGVTRPRERPSTVLGAPFEGYSSGPVAIEEFRPETATSAMAGPPTPLDPDVGPPWEEMVLSALSLHRRFEKGNADSDVLLRWDERVQRLGEIFEHYRSLVGEIPEPIWTKLFRDALLIPGSAPYAAVTTMLTEEFLASDSAARDARLTRLQEQYGVEAELLEQARSHTQPVPTS